MQSNKHPHRSKQEGWKWRTGALSGVTVALEFTMQTRRHCLCQGKVCIKILSSGMGRDCDLSFGDLFREGQLFVIRQVFFFHLCFPQLVDVGRADGRLCSLGKK